MPMNTIDYIVVTIVIIVVIGIFYRGLKEPIDLILAWIGRMLGAGRDKLVNMGSEGEGTTRITYG